MNCEMMASRSRVRNHPVGRRTFVNKLDVEPEIAGTFGEERVDMEESVCSVRDESFWPLGTTRTAYFTYILG